MKFPEFNLKASKLNPRNWFKKTLSKEETLDILLDFADFLKEKADAKGIFRLSGDNNQVNETIKNILDGKKLTSKKLTKKENEIILKNKEFINFVNEINISSTKNILKEIDNFLTEDKIREILKNPNSTENSILLSINKKVLKKIEKIEKNKKITLKDEDPILYANVFKRLFINKHISGIFTKNDLMQGNKLVENTDFETIITQKINALKSKKDDHQQEVFKILLDLFKTVAEKQKNTNNVEIDKLAIIISICFFGELPTATNTIRKQNEFTTYLIKNANLIINQIAESQEFVDFQNKSFAEISQNPEIIPESIQNLLPQNSSQNKYDRLISSRNIKL